MSFKTEMQAMASELINDVFGITEDGDVSKLVTVMREIYDNIDEATDTVYSSTQSFMVYGILGPWEKDAVNSQTSDDIKTNDQKLVVAYTDMLWVPTADKDTVSINDTNEIYLITFVQIDAADATMKLQLRRIKGTA